MTSTEIALLLHKDTDKIKRIGEIIGKKISKRDCFDELNEYEKTFIYIDILEHHVNNGGFIQFFFNTSGQFTHEIFQAYLAINAEKTVDILTKAIYLFPEIPVPKNHKIRQYLLMQHKENLDLWDDLDIEFEKSDDDIIALTLDFVSANILHFD
ncbi:DMP19 family protein [Polaribacter tangerinus]|uniref:DMP19 family protein n=1 Tax=Polaribacter tangerinus TaxID=1920034 RepID=UPI000B4B7E1E|nr:DUF4375 domain-containing protein [Polaribacter tangerinus]